MFILGNLLFKWITAGWPPLSHMVGLAMLLALVPVAHLVSPLVLGCATTLVLVIVAVWEVRSLGNFDAHEADVHMAS